MDAVMGHPRMDRLLEFSWSWRDSIALFYKSVMNKNALEVMSFDEQDKVKKMVAHYT